MFELGILCIIAVAAIYWMTMWLIGRREDVLYGSFVTPASGSDMVRELPPELPRRPRKALRHSATGQPAGILPTPAPRSSQPQLALHPLQRSNPAADSMPQRAMPQRNEVLTSLLEAIKRDLGEASRG